MADMVARVGSSGLRNLFRKMRQHQAVTGRPLPPGMMREAMAAELDTLAARSSEAANREQQAEQFNKRLALAEQSEAFRQKQIEDANEIAGMGGLIDLGYKVGKPLVKNLFSKGSSTPKAVATAAPMTSGFWGGSTGNPWDTSTDISNLENNLRKTMSADTGIDFGWGSGSDDWFGGSEAMSEPASKTSILGGGTTQPSTPTVSGFNAAPIVGAVGANVAAQQIGGNWGGVMAPVVQDVVGGVAEVVSESTVICTELHRQGLIDDETYRADALFGAKQSLAVWIGYYWWASHVAQAMSKSKTITALVAPFAKAFAAHAAYVEGVAEHDNILGRVITKIGIPLCRRLGRNLAARLAVSERG